MKVSLILNGETLRAFPVDQDEDKDATFTTSIHYSTQVHARANGEMK